MDQLELKKTIAALATQLASNPSQLQAQIEVLRQVLPTVTDAQIQELLATVSRPGFSVESVTADVEALLRR